jgi:hypothetical protein
MNLAAAIELSAGGPGSGCRGENCGRPKLSGQGKLGADEATLRETGQKVLVKPDKMGGAEVYDNEGNFLHVVPAGEVDNKLKIPFPSAPYGGGRVTERHVRLKRSTGRQLISPSDRARKR